MYSFILIWIKYHPLTPFNLLEQVFNQINLIGGYYNGRQDYCM